MNAFGQQRQDLFHTVFTLFIAVEQQRQQPPGDFVRQRCDPRGLFD